MKRLHLILATLTLCFAGCQQYAIRGGVSFSDSGREVDVSIDRKSVRLHGGIDVGGKNVGGELDLPLQRRAGFAK